MRSNLRNIAGFAAAAIAAVALAADAPDLTPPNVPAAIRVPAGNTAFAKGHAIGTQGYICLPTGTGSYAWSKTGSASGPGNNSRPNAILFNSSTKEIIAHFLSPNPRETSPNPSEIGQPRPTWQSMADNSVLWGKTIGSISAGADPSCANIGAVPCLLLQTVGAQAGPTGGTRLSETTYIQRLATTGGTAPAAPQNGCAECCASSTDVGNQLLVPYTADYWFYKASR